MEAIPSPPAVSFNDPSSPSTSESSTIKRSRFRGLPTGSPFRTLRQRLFTEDTIPVRNTSASPKIDCSRTNSSSLLVHQKYSFTMTPENPNGTPYTMTDENPFTTEDATEDATETDYDDDSTVSTMSKDSARRMTPEPSRIEDANKPPPGEIFVRRQSSDMETSNLMALPPVQQSTAQSESESQSQLNWENSWVQGGADNKDKVFRKSPSLPQLRLRPPVVTRSLSFPVASYRLNAPNNVNTYAKPPQPHHHHHHHHHQPSALATYKAAAPEPIITASSQIGEEQQTNNDGAFVHELDLLSPKPDLCRVNTDTTAPTSTTMATNLTPFAPTITTTRTPARERFVFRPVMKRAFTTASAAALQPRSIPVPNPNQQPHHSNCTSVVGTTSSLSSNLSFLLGDRPRRKNVRGSASVFSFGSIVGESSLMTPTSPTSMTASESNSPADNSNRNNNVKQFLQLVKANERLYQHFGSDDDTTFMSYERRRKSAVQQDLEFLWKRAVKPVRRWTGTEERVDLQRSHTGCLT